MLVVALVVAACSRVELAYEYGDRFASGRIANFLDLDRAQRGEVRTRLQAYREFHREYRLPALVAYLERSANLVEADATPAEALAEHLDDGWSLLEETAVDVVPMAVDILLALTPAQIDHLEAQLAEGREDFAESRRDPDADRAVERVEAWTGRLSAPQRALLRSCEARIPDETDAWLEWRAGRDEQFIDMLRNGVARDRLEAFVKAWWTDMGVRSAQVRRASRISREVWPECGAELLAGLSSQQRERALQRLDRYGSDFSSLVASGAAGRGASDGVARR